MIKFTLIYPDHVFFTEPRSQGLHVGDFSEQVASGYKPHGAVYLPSQQLNVNSPRAHHLVPFGKRLRSYGKSPSLIGK